jgi:hypothetical protein
VKVERSAASPLNDSHQAGKSGAERIGSWWGERRFALHHFVALGGQSRISRSPSGSCTRLQHVDQIPSALRWRLNWRISCSRCCRCR